MFARSVPTALSLPGGGNAHGAVIQATRLVPWYKGDLTTVRSLL